MKIGIIGFGSMGRMLMHKFLETGTIMQEELYVSNRTTEKLSEISFFYPKVNICNNESVVQSSDLIFICVRPAQMKDVAEIITPHIKNRQHICAVNACIRFNQLDSIFPGTSCSIAIPSVTGEVNKSVTLVSFNSYVSKHEVDLIKSLLSSFSSVIVIPENELGICTDLTSCMPGFIASIFDIIVEEASQHSSLSKDEIHSMIITTILGTSKLCVDQKMSFDKIVERVATKGGITEEGEKVIRSRFPEIVKSLFQHTREKRENTINNFSFEPKCENATLWCKKQ
ncbi:MAG: NAD(P)-binding domain-containing protein [Rikenellaceae bacterium]|jgi:pyrroline-5-carboxylate reductase